MTKKDRRGVHNKVSRWSGQSTSAPVPAATAKRVKAEIQKATEELVRASPVESSAVKAVLAETLAVQLNHQRWMLVRREAGRLGASELRALSGIAGTIRRLCADLRLVAGELDAGGPKPGESADDEL